MNEQDERIRHARARVGTLVAGKFLVQRLLGVGGMAAVYAAQHRNGDRVALKVLHEPLRASLQQRQRLLREATVANAIVHSGVVRIFDNGIDQAAGAYLVMELLEGATVAELCRSTPNGLSLAIVLSLADQLLDVLAVAHARGIVHRDIKPGNLFVTEAGELKVVDFGIAGVLDRVAGETGTTLDTQRGAMLGTPAFMPQEQARGRWDEVDARSDLWAVGATLFTLTSGANVHEGGTPNEQLGRAMTVPVRSLATVADHVPQDLARLVDRALRFEPAERWPDALTMQAALRALSSFERVSRHDVRQLFRSHRATDMNGAITQSSLDAIVTNVAGGARSGLRALGVALVVLAAAAFALHSLQPSPETPNARQRIVETAAPVLSTAQHAQPADHVARTVSALTESPHVQIESAPPQTTPRPRRVAKARKPRAEPATLDPLDLRF